MSSVYLLPMSPAVHGIWISPAVPTLNVGAILGAGRGGGKRGQPRGAAAMKLAVRIRELPIASVARVPIQRGPAIGALTHAGQALVDEPEDALGDAIEFDTRAGVEKLAHQVGFL